MSFSTKAEMGHSHRSQKAVEYRTAENMSSLKVMFNE